MQHISYVMIQVTDMDRSVAFYRDKLGLELRFASPEWSEFETGQTTLALHGGAKGERGSNGAPGSASIGFDVTDLDATHAELSARGVAFSLPPSDRAGEGIRLAIATDPDGAPISFTQRT